MNRLFVRFAKERRSLSYEDEEAQSEFYKDPEGNEALQTLSRAQGALDDAMLGALQAGC